MENKQNRDKFPGYPHYPAREDITRAKNNTGKESLDADSIPQPYNNEKDGSGNKSAIISGTDTDISEEDLRMLDAAEQNMNTEDDNNLQQSSLDDTDTDGDPLNEDSSLNRDMTGESLDVPGSAADDSDENIGNEDEENNYYSLGGDNHEAQEESKGE